MSEMPETGRVSWTFWAGFLEGAHMVSGLCLSGTLLLVSFRAKRGTPAFCDAGWAECRRRHIGCADKMRGSLHCGPSGLRSRGHFFWVFGSSSKKMMEGCLLVPTYSLNARLCMCHPERSASARSRRICGCSLDLKSQPQILRLRFSRWSLR